MRVNSVGGAEHLSNFRLVAGEIVEGDQAAESRHVSSKHLCRFTLIKPRSTVLGDAFERGGEFRLPEGFADAIHFPVVQENVAAHGKTLKVAALLRKFADQFFADRETIFSEAYGGLHDGGEFHRTVSSKS